MLSEYRKIVDPTDMHKSLKDFDNEYYESIVKIEKVETKVEESVQHLIDEALKIEHGEPLSTIDLYALLECPKRHAATNEELLLHYKQMILRFHPDKCHHLGIKDELFKAIQLSYDLLTVAKTRKSYDSFDPYMIAKVPSPEEYMDGDVVDENKFYKAFEVYFNQLTHFSVNKKMPKFADIKEDKVGQFYNVWLKYTSWRTFDLDSIMELRSTSGGRDERRHRQKELQKAWETARKDAAVETSEAIQLAMQLDPRCQRLKEKELAEKERKKEELRQRKIEMAAKRNGGKLPEQPAKKIVIKQVVRPKSASKQPDWTKEESAALIKATNKIPGGATDRFDKIAQEIKKQCKTSYLRSKSDVVEKMKSLKSGESTESIKDLQTKVEKSGDVTEATIDYDRKSTKVEWTNEQQKQLEAAMKKFTDKNDSDRWDKIAALVEGKTKKECVTRVVELKQKVTQKK